MLENDPDEKIAEKIMERATKRNKILKRIGLLGGSVGLGAFISFFVATRAWGHPMSWTDGIEVAVAFVVFILIARTRRGLQSSFGGYSTKAPKTWEH